MFGKTLLVGAASLLLVAAAGVAQFPEANQAAARVPDEVIGTGAEWHNHNGDSNETGFSRLSGIKAGNVSRLGLAWSLDLPGEASLEATPLAVDGILYFTGSYAAVYAVDAATGKLLWKFDPKTWQHNPFRMYFSLPANRGAAYANGKIFSAALDGRLFALDPKTGRVIWSTDTTEKTSRQNITGAPRVFNGKVIIGQGGADFGARGYVSAYDQETGKLTWRFYVAPGTPEENRGDPVMEQAAATWNGEYWKTGTGGGPWDSITFDAALNRIYVGTANAAPYDPEVRSPGGGDNLYTASIVALDADTGKYVWHYQINPRDSWDFDCTQQMTLADLVIDGKPRKVLMQAPKNGFFYVLDRMTGKVISAEKFGKANWAARIDLKTGRPVEAKNIRFETGSSIIWPFSGGAHSWMRMSYSPATGLVYIPYMQMGIRYLRGKPIEGGLFIGGIGLKDYKADPEDGKGALIAWDPVAQKARWRVPEDTLWNGGTLSTSGNLVFQGTADGYLSAYDARSGKRLWRYYVGMGIIAAPMTYSSNGKQYVSVLAGYGGSAAMWGEIMNAGWKYSGPRRLLTFALDGKAVLAPSAPATLAVNALDDPSEKLDPKAIAAGQAISMACAPCHGRNLVAAGGPAPDLRESPIPLDSQAFWSVVHDGGLIQNGMPGFGAFNQEQIEGLRQYIRSMARKVKK
jgi:quinohemoprotein ethanol dehydrogenase